MKIGDRVFVRGYIDEIRKDTVIIRNNGGYFGTVLSEVTGELPSAQPEMNLDEWCTDCKEYDHERHCCPRWNRVIRTTLKDMKEEQPEIVRCKDCIKREMCRTSTTWAVTPKDDWYCADAERRTDESD